MKKLSILAVAVFIFANLIFAQQPYSLITEIKKQLSSDQLKTIDDAQQLIKQGDDLRSKANSLMQQAQQAKNKANQLKGHKKRVELKKAQQLEAQALDNYISSSIKYGLANKKLYQTYKQNLTELSNKLPANERTEFMQLVNQADKSYAKAKDLRRKGIAASDNQTKYKYFQQAEQLEKEAVELQEQAYSLYFDKIHKHQQQTALQNVKAKKQSANPVANNNQQSKQITAQPKPTPTQPTSKPQTQTQPKQRTYTIPAPQQANIYFRVQVAASKKPLTAAKLQQIYPGKVYYEFDPYDRMYKYLTLETFPTYEQAKQFKQRINVPGAFVVAYKNGKRVRDITTVVKEP